MMGNSSVLGMSHTIIYMCTHAYTRTECHTCFFVYMICFLSSVMYDLLNIRNESKFCFAGIVVTGHPVNSIFLLILIVEKDTLRCCLLYKCSDYCLDANGLIVRLTNLMDVYEASLVAARLERYYLLLHAFYLEYNS